MRGGNLATMEKSKLKELLRGYFGKGCAMNWKSALDKLIKTNFGGRSVVDEVNHVI